VARATPGRLSTTLSTSPEAPGTWRAWSAGTSVERTCLRSGGAVTTISSSSEAGAGPLGGSSISYAASTRLPASKVSSVRTPATPSPERLTARLPGGTPSTLKWPASSVTTLGPPSTWRVTRASGFWLLRRRTTPSKTAVVGTSARRVKV
jgi:hypothetical protein